MSSTSFYPTATMKNWKKKMDATFGIDEKGLVLVVLLQILGGDGSLLWLLFGSLIGVSSVHSCPICSVRYTSFSDISHNPQRMGSRSGLPVPIYPLRCTSPRSSQYWVANHDILDVVGSDRELHQISFWDISSAHCGPQKCSFCASVLPCRAPRGRPFFNDVLLDWESIQSPWVTFFAGFAFLWEMSTSAIDYSLIPIKKAFWALHFWTQLFTGLSVLIWSAHNLSIWSLSNFWTQFLNPLMFQGDLGRRPRWRKNFLEYDFSSSHHDILRDTISWECVVKDDFVRPCLIELKSFLLSKFYVDPIHRVFMFLPLFLLVPCKTRCFQVNFVRISVFFVHRIHRRKEYRLSFAQVLSSRYQSWICDGM